MSLLFHNAAINAGGFGEPQDFNQIVQIVALVAVILNEKKITHRVLFKTL